MKFLIASLVGESAGIAQRLKQEGNDVTMWIKEAYAKKSFDGMVNKVKTFQEGLNLKPEVVLFDSTGMGKMADEARKRGHYVVGGGQIQDKLESDRKYAHKVMETFGIGIPNSFDFQNLMSAMKFVATHKKRLVMKPSGSHGSEMTFAGKTNDELLNYMMHVKKNLKIDTPVVMQEFIEGEEISTEIWFSNGVPVPYPNATFETKKLMYGNVGPGTGAENSVVWWYEKREPKIVQQSMKKLFDFLKRSQVNGPVDINGIIRAGKFYGLEFTPRMGYNAVYALARTFDEDLGAFFYRVSHGDASAPKLKGGYGYSIRTSIPPYPTKPEDPRLSEEMYRGIRGLPITGFTKEDEEKRLFFINVYQEGKNTYCSGVDGLVCECTGFSYESGFEAEKEALDLFYRLQIPNKQARLGDGAYSAQKRMDKLTEMGYEIPPFARPEKKQEIPQVAEYQKKVDNTEATPKKEEVSHETNITVVVPTPTKINPKDLPAHSHMRDSTASYPGKA